MKRSRLAVLFLGAILVALAGCGTETGGTIPKISGAYNGVLVFYHLPDTTTGDTLVASANIAAGPGGTFTGRWKAELGFRDSLAGSFDQTLLGNLSTDGNDIAPLKFRLHVDQTSCTGDFTSTEGYFARLYGVNLWSFEGSVQGSASCYKFGAAQKGVFIVIGKAFAPSHLGNPFEPVSSRPAARLLRSAH